MGEGRPLTALVLGAGGNVSQGILKSLAASMLATRVVAACISPLSAGLYAADRALISPRADDEAFGPWLEQVCREEEVGVVLSGAEPVLDALAPLAGTLHERTGASAIVSPPETLEVGRDKLLTAQWLEREGLPFARTADAADRAAIERLAGELGLPLMAKPRRGKGGAGVALLRSDAELELVVGRPELVVQEPLAGEQGEYTVGCVCDREGRVAGTLAMRRELEAGTTYRAEAGEFPELRAAAERIATALRPTGPLNVQLRLNEGKPVAFDLNVRFSGTTPMRARLGFNEVEAAIRHFVLGESLELPEVTTGRVLRYWNEVYVPDEAYERLERDGRLDETDGSGRFEDWGRSP